MEIVTRIDSTHISWGKMLTDSASDAEITLQNSTAILDRKDTLTVHPVQGLFTAGRLRLTDSDSTTLIVANTSNRFSIKAKEGSKYTPVIKMNSHTGDFAYRDSLNRARISGLELDMDAAMNSIEKENDDEGTPGFPPSGLQECPERFCCPVLPQEFRRLRKETAGLAA